MTRPCPMGVCSALVDLVLPAGCVGCGAGGAATVCARCAAALAAAVPARVQPLPAPDGAPATTALAWYAGTLRAAILGYKERGRTGAARVLGDRLADVVQAAVPGDAPLLLLPIPATGQAVRRRRSDHMRILAARAAAALRRRGRPAAVARPLRALPRADSAGLTAAERAAAAAGSFVARPRQVRPVRAAVEAGVVAVLVDDVMTTGATLANAAITLGDAGVVVRAAAVLAATRRSGPVSARGIRPDGRSASAHHQ